jgi:hypothetical protein
MKFHLTVEITVGGDESKFKKTEFRKITVDAKSEPDARKLAFDKYRSMGWWVRSMYLRGVLS